MALQYKFYSVPVVCEPEIEEDLNTFLRSHSIITIHRELICQNGCYSWALAIEYQSGDKKEGTKKDTAKKRIDYKEVLSPKAFSVFARLREWRKETAAKEAVQLYNIFMNDQLAAMVEKRITTKEGLRGIEGIGEARVKKYGEAVLSILKNEFSKLEKQDEKGKPSVREDSNP